MITETLNAAPPGGESRREAWERRGESERESRSIYHAQLPPLGPEKKKERMKILNLGICKKAEALGSIRGKKAKSHV